jgi:hypothetical protein
VAATIADAAHNEFCTKSQLIRLILKGSLIKHRYPGEQALR